MGKDGYWKCFGCQYLVPKGEPYCNGCGHQPPAHISQKVDNKGQDKDKAKGKGKGKGKAESPTTSKGDSEAAGQALLSKLKSSQSENSSLKAQLKELNAKRAAEASSPVEAKPQENMAVDEEAPAAQAAIQQILSDIADFKTIPESARLHIAGGYDSALASLEQKLEEAKRSKRESNPLRKRLEDTESWQKRIAEKLDSAKQEIEKKEAEAQALAA